MRHRLSESITPAIPKPLRMIPEQVFPRGYDVVAVTAAAEAIRLLQVGPGVLTLSHPRPDQEQFLRGLAGAGVESVTAQYLR
jgi:hypothetical protein